MGAQGVIAVKHPDQRRQRAAGIFVLIVLVIACVVFWVGVPLGFLWALSKATDNGTTHFVVGLLGAPLAMVAFSPVLFWLNNLYLRVTGVLDRLDEWRRRVHGPLEPILFLALAIALIALSIWFFAFAHDPPTILG
jgi:hypothetical protein